MSVQIEESILNNFLVHLLDQYIKKHGFSYRKLKEFHFWTTSLFEGVLPIKETQNENFALKHPSTVDYMNELIERNYVALNKQTGTQFYLTREGFDAGMLLRHPYRAWLKEYRSEITSAVISAIVSSVIGLLFSA